MTEDKPNQQFFSQIGKAKRVFIAIPPVANADAAGAAVALALFLFKLQKDVELISEDDFTGKFPFLPKGVSIKKRMPVGQSLSIVVDTSKKSLEELSYVQEPGKVKIFLTSGGEIFSREDVSFEAQKAPYDLGIILGAQSLEDLGNIFEANTDTFYATPKVNIDNSASNKYFGSINIVDINASSVSEIATQLLEELESNLFDEDIATSLLSGIIAKTQSFQHPLVSPKSFLKASQLVALGARQQEIVKALFKTKPLPLLKLWGRALARLKDAGRGAVAALGQMDFAKAGSGLDFLPSVLKELVDHLSSKQFVALLGESADATTKVFLAVRENYNWQEAFKGLGQPSRELKALLLRPFLALEFDFAGPLPEAEKIFEQATIEAG